ncbi:hypothetical protein E4U55_000116 [Claviceps digitariae]|nr:hypothetical protein E4U55_000116 [Claviceps digitariae]
MKFSTTLGALALCALEVSASPVEISSVEKRQQPPPKAWCCTLVCTITIHKANTEDCAQWSWDFGRQCPGDAKGSIQKNEYCIGSAP